jgi:hypothetical protein
MSDLVKVIGKYLKLIPHGSEYKAVCPFHSEKSPSFTIVPDRNFVYCFGCGWSGDAIEFVKEHESLGFKQSLAKVCEILEVDEKKYMSDKEEIKKVVVKKDKTVPMDIEDVKKLISEIGYNSNGYRGIRDDINKFFGHLTKIENGKVVARYYPETNHDSKVTGYTCRNHPKDFSYGHIGNVGSSGQMSGQVKFKTPHKYCLLVGGQEDKAAAYQMLLDSQKDSDYSAIPVVSPNKGENCAKQVAENYEWFDSHDIIIIGMDNDKAGIEAAKKIAEVLPKDKVRIATWSGKDPNQMLEEGKQKQFVRDFYNAKEYKATGIKSGADALAEVKEFLTAPKLPLPPHMHRIQDAHRGGLKSSGFIGNIIADTSVGKTFVTDTLLNFWIPQDDLVPVVVSIERTAGEFMADLLSIYLAKNLTWFKEGEDAVDYLERPEVKELIQSFIYDDEGKQRFYVIDERDGSLEILQNKMELAAAKYGTKLFIIDPLTDILRALGNDIQDMHMLWQKQQKKKGWMILNVLHTRKPPSDKDGKTRPVTEYDAYGSSTFVQSSDFNWVLNRDKMAENDDERNTMSVDIPKVRGGTTGRAAELIYDVHTRRHHDKVDWLTNQVFIPKTHELSEPPITEAPPIESYEVESVIRTDEDIEWN